MYMKEIVEAKIDSTNSMGPRTGTSGSSTVKESKDSPPALLLFF